MLVYSSYPKSIINKSIHNLIFEMEKNAHENPTFENILKEPFEKIGLKGELGLINQHLMKI